MLNDEQPEKRYEKKGFGAAIRRQQKKLCNRYQLRYPPWLDGNDILVVHNGANRSAPACLGSCFSAKGRELI